MSGPSPASLPAPRPLVLADVLPGERVRDVLLVLGCAALVGLSAQVVIPLPFTPVPISGQTFAVLLGGIALGSARGAAGLLLYLCAGLAGVPWFADGDGGVAAAASASFGYIVGFVVAAGLVGLLAERGFDRSPWRILVAMAAGNLVIYAVGVPWLMAVVDVGPLTGLALGVAPFLVGDALKALLAAALVPTAWAVVGRRAG